MTYTWTALPTFANGAGNELAAADLNILSGDLGLLHQDFYKHALLWHKDSAVVVGNAITLVVATTQQWGEYAYQNPDADGDSFEQSFMLRAGTYTVHFLGQTTTDSGIIDWTIDGTSIKLGQDWNAALAANVEKTVSNVVISSTGRHVLTGTVNGTSGAPGDYNIRLTAIWFEWVS